MTYNNTSDFSNPTKFTLNIGQTKISQIPYI